jgi:hypothetical protein
LPFKISYKDQDSNSTHTIGKITKLEGVFDPQGKLQAYCLYQGSKPTEHRRLGVVPLKDIIQVDAYLPKPPKEGTT